MSSAHQNTLKTGLDHYHGHQTVVDENSRTQKGTNKRKILHTLSGNFNARSHGAECSLQQYKLLDNQKYGHKCSKEKAQMYLNELTNILKTELDHSYHDHETVADENSMPRIDANKKKILHTLSGNFNARSHGAECSLQQRKLVDNQKHGHKCSKENAQRYLNELLQLKEQQLEKLLQRVSTLHNYNEQFAGENKQLQQHVLTLQDQIEVLRKRITDCSKCHQFSVQLKATTEHEKELDADVKMLKTLVYRLNVQIEAYQDKLRSSNNDDQDNPIKYWSQTATKTSNTIENWGTTDPLHTHTLRPLLSAYDEMLGDKEDLVQQYRQELEHFTGELKRAVQENNRLLQENESLKRDFGSWREERTRLQAQLKVCRTKVEAHARVSDLAKEKLVEVMHCYEQKVQALVLDLDHTQSAYFRCKAELATLKRAMSQPGDNIAQSLQECKDLLEDLKREHSKETETFQNTIKDLNAQKEDLQRRNDELERQIATLRKDLEQKVTITVELEGRVNALQHSLKLMKQSSDRLKTRLPLALQWAQRLEEGQTKIQSTWNALKRLEGVVKHKEAQMQGLHERHLQEIEKMEKKLAQKEETIRTILKGKLSKGVSAHLN